MTEKNMPDTVEQLVAKSDNRADRLILRWVAILMISAGSLTGGASAFLMPSSWLFVPQEAVAAEHDHSSDDGGGKEFWA